MSIVVYILVAILVYLLIVGGNILNNRCGVILMAIGFFGGAIILSCIAYFWWELDPIFVAALGLAPPVATFAIDGNS